MGGSHSNGLCQPVATLRQLTRHGPRLSLLRDGRVLLQSFWIAERGRRSPSSLHHKDRIFFGHGAFSADGAQLFTTKNDIETGHGIVGVWDARNGYKRVGAFASGGIGPHDIKLLPDAEVLAIANGGIETHPETGRTKLNIPTMRPNLTYATLDGQIMERIALSHDHHKNSIRHLAVTRDATAAFVMQWQGDLSDHVPLLGTHRLGQGGPALAKAEAFKGMQAYVGSVAAHRRSIAITSPRGGIFLEIDARDLALTHQMHMRDVCGVAPERDGFV